MEGILVFLAVILISLGYVPFMRNFESRFARSFIHWGHIALIIFIVISLAFIGNTFMEISRYIALIGLIALVVWDFKKYGFLWTIGLVLYTAFTIVLVVGLINAIADLISGKEK